MKYFCFIDLMVLRFAQRMYKIRKEDESDNHFRMMRMTLGMNGVRRLSISIKIRILSSAGRQLDKIKGTVLSRIVFNSGESCQR